MKPDFAIAFYASEALFLLPLLLLGCITSYQDFRFSIIRNKWVVLGIVYPLCLHALLGILACLKINIPSSYSVLASEDIRTWVINLLLSAAISCILWTFKVWGGGDAKLFVSYAALIPESQYSIVYFSFFPSFSLLIAIFIPTTVFIFLKVIRFYCTEFRKKALMLQQQLNATSFAAKQGRILFGFTLSYLLLFIIGQEIQRLPFEIRLNKNFHTIILMAAYNTLSKFFNRVSKIHILCLIFALFLLWGPVPAVSRHPVLYFPEILRALQKSFFLMIGMNIFNAAINIYVENTVKKTMPLAPWMFLGALMVWFF